MRLLKEGLIKIKRHEKGFTLIEVILTVAIMGLIISTALGAYRGTLSTYGVILKKSDVFLNARTVLTRIEEDIKYAKEVNLLDETYSGSGNYKKIEVAYINSQGQRETVYYYFNSATNTVLRESNGTSNPVAQVEDLYFSWEDKNLSKVKIALKLKYNETEYVFYSQIIPLSLLLD